jgi:hypothetical protein
MKYQVIAAFIDKRNGEQIEPGSPVPDGLDRETIRRLIAANCLRPVEGEETPASEPGGDSADGHSQGQPGGEGDGLGLFSGEGAGASSGAAGTSGEADAAGSTGQPAGRRGRRSADTGNAQ